MAVELSTHDWEMRGKEEKSLSVLVVLHRIASWDCLLGWLDGYWVGVGMGLAGVLLLRIYVIFIFFGVGMG
jgi:hypothetical protein